MNDLLLLSPGLKVASAPTLNCLIRGWESSHSKLHFSLAAGKIPLYLLIDQLLILLTRQLMVTERELIEGKGLLATRKILSVANLALSDRGWKTVEQIQGSLRSNRNRGLRLLAQLIPLLNTSQGHTDGRLLHAAGWSWRWPKGEKQGWNLPTKMWACIAQQHSMPSEKLNRWWFSLDSQAIWRSRWSHLCKGWTSPSVNLFLWKVINADFFTNSCALKWKVNDRRCTGCQVNTETIEHMFYDCTRLRPRWLQLEHLVDGTSTNKAAGWSFFGKLDTTIRSQKRNPGFLLLIHEMIKCLWNERNQRAFQANATRFPLHFILHSTATSIHAILHRTRGVKRPDVFLRHSLKSLR